jgi:hypothetical protein
MDAEALLIHRELQFLRTVGKYHRRHRFKRSRRVSARYVVERARKLNQAERRVRASKSREVTP